MPSSHRGLGASPGITSQRPTPDPDEVLEHRQWLLSRTGLVSAAGGPSRLLPGGQTTASSAEQVRQSARLRRPLGFIPATRLSIDLVVGEDEDRRAERERLWLVEREARERLLRDEEERERIRGVFGDEDEDEDEEQRPKDIKPADLSSTAIKEEESLASESTPLEAPTATAADNLSTFYASLVSQMPIEPIRPPPPPVAPSIPILSSPSSSRPVAGASHSLAAAQGKRKRDYRQTLGQEWFIKRAEEELVRRRNEEMSRRSAADSGVPPFGEASATSSSFSSSPDDEMEVARSRASKLCEACHLPLPTPLDPASLSSHNRSLAHLLASESTAPPQRPLTGMGAAPKSTLGHVPRDATDPEAARGRMRREKDLVAIERGNRGYEALRRMGWRLGMGLGMDEWRRARGKGDAVPVAVTLPKGEREEDAIEVLDSDDEREAPAASAAAQQRELESVETSQQQQQQQQPTVATSFGPPPTTRTVQSGQRTSTSLADPPKSSSSSSSSSSKARLIPVLPTLRPDRRGIGLPVPSPSSSSSHGNGTSTLHRSKQSQNPTHGQGQGQTRRMTPRQRKREAQRERLEWERIREELNW